jgi:ubiquinone/menaquinone biosynthesis C-methylase UbiE
MTNSSITPEILATYADHTLEGRHRIAMKWIDDQVESLLDAGCSYGYATRYYATKATKTVGIELDDQLFAVGVLKYPSIEFVQSSVDDTPFPDNSFDCIVMTDVLEHVPDTQRALNELHRLLRPGGSVIITTPHKGLFSLFDPSNYGYYLQRYCAPLYKILYKSIRLIKEGQIPQSYNSLHRVKHHHYSYRDFMSMLDASDFAGHYRIERQLRSGLFLEVLLLNFEVLMKFVIKNPKTVRRILQPLAWLADKDYSISYGIFAFNIGLKVRKFA